MVADLEIENNEENENDEDSTLTESALDELESDTNDEFTEGFGEVSDDEKREIINIDTPKESVEDEIEEEEDAEDVDYDSFDDVDEM